MNQASIPGYAAVILGTARKQMVRKFMTVTRRNCLPSKGDHRQRKKKKNEPKKCSLLKMIDTARKNEQPSTSGGDIEESVPTTREVILEAQLDLANRELKDLEGKLQYKGMRYTVAGLEEDVIRMETGLPTKKVFDIVVNYALRFKDSISYFAGWNVELISHIGE